MQGFGSMLKDYLEFYKISQTDFAERLGISTKHMNEILSGKIDIKPIYDKTKKISACKYCEYKTICAFNPKINKYEYININ